MWGIVAVAVCGVAQASPPDPCSLLTAAQVSAALGATADEGKAVTPKFCQWTAPGKSGASQKVALTILDALATQQQRGENSLVITIEPDLIPDAVNALRSYRKLGAGEG